MNKIFISYFQSESGLKQKGFGLGLASTKSFLQQVDGTITCESVLGIGSEFIVKIPITEYTKMRVEVIGNNGLNNAECEDNNQNLALDGTLKTVLIVEDNLELIYYLKAFLDTHYNVHHLQNGLDALDDIQRIVPDIILADIMMPKLDGISLCRSVKKNPLSNHIPFIFLTAIADEKTLDTALKAGADGYLQKPVNNEELLLRLKNLVKQQDRFQSHLLNTVLKTNVEKNLAKNSKNLPFRQVTFLEDLKSLILKHMSSPAFDVGFLCQYYHTNHVSLNKKVRALTGLTTGKFVRKIKLSYAYKKLENGNGRRPKFRY